MDAHTTSSETATLEECFRSIASDLSLVVDLTLTVDSFRVQRLTTRAIAREQIHISFKFGIERADTLWHGCLLVPLPAAVALAGHLMMLDDAEVAARFSSIAPGKLDPALRDALVEVAGFVARAIEKAFLGLGYAQIRVDHESCQGVRAEAAPSFDCVAGAELLVGHARAHLERAAPFDMILMLPALILADASAS